MRSITYFAVPLLSATCAFAQLPVPTPVFPEELRQYLNLSNDQVDKMIRLHMEYNRTAAEKSVRIVQLQREIREETERTDLDPMALGLRYAEMEGIRRELNDLQLRLHENVVALLNEAQRTKLKALEDAVKLQPLIGQAVCENLLRLPPQAPGNIIPALRLEGSQFGFFGCGPFRGIPPPVFLPQP